MKTLSFFVRVLPPGTSRDIDEHLPAHALVLQPLLAGARSVYLVGEVKDKLVAEDLRTIGREFCSGLELDCSAELLRGHERLWNAMGWARGAILVV